ncbi:hypothetical protein KW850_26095 [Bacillus sp. sid0103]|uniref:hypothetical protein n=1 Tax=Bacillus sp. sid0103 TaxID=2856337 RepID=UPI001C44D636|nr:hypothetical protein [Bacillus sp. sid0103]MBV7508691.1 hypothetical protein [Bacillus sp. sid0103]
MKQIQTRKITRGRRGNKLKVKISRLSIEVPECIKDDFREAVERNGKTMKDVLTLYMQKYIWKQGELQRNRQRRREDIG